MSIKPSRYVILIAVILLVPGLFYVYSLEDEDEETELRYEEVLGREITVELYPDTQNKLYVLDMEPGASDFTQGMTGAACLTPLFINTSPDNGSYNPVMVGTGEKGVDSITSLSDRTVITLSSEDLDSTAYLDVYTRSSACFLVSDYSEAISAGPAASLLGIPIFNEDDPTADSTMKELDVEFVIALGSTGIPGSMEFVRFTEAEMQQFYLDLLRDRGMTSNYLVITNPDDITDYQDQIEDGKLPVPGISLLSAQLAAYRHAPILFAEGLPEFDKDYGDGNTQLGVSREVNNEYADRILNKVHEGVDLLETNGMTAEYLALVGGPVTLPMYSWDINDYQADRQYTPCDYYFGNLNEDPYQELAVGRIFARSLTDASLLVMRSIAFDEVMEYDYPSDSSSAIYDTVSEDWRENSLACVGTTKIGPFPGILTPTLYNQTVTMTEAGFHVTSTRDTLAISGRPGWLTDCTTTRSVRMVQSAGQELSTLWMYSRTWCVQRT